MLEAAEVHGANPWQIFSLRTVSLLFTDENQGRPLPRHRAQVGPIEDGRRHPGVAARVIGLILVAPIFFMILTSSTRRRTRRSTRRSCSRRRASTKFLRTAVGSEPLYVINLKIVALKYIWFLIIP